MEKRLLEFLAGERQISRQGYKLRLLSAWELLQAKREAQTLGTEPETGGLRHNAAVLARAVVRGGVRIFSSGEELMKQWSAEKIAREMAAYRAMAVAVSPDWSSPETDELMALLREEPEERIRWKVLKAFGVLPADPVAREMTRGDYLYCAMQLMLDRQEQLDRLCHGCRERAETNRCTVCGREIAGEVGKNPSFDEKRFEEMKRGG